MISVKNTKTLKKEQELKKELELEIEKEKDEDRRKYFFFILIFLILLFFSTFGLTVSFYKGSSDDNIIITDNIIFTYSDVNKGGSGINIKNATPLPDSAGKIQVGAGKYFDFSVTATSKKSNIGYRILVKKDSSSTLNNKDLRIYLTKIDGSFETQAVLTTFSNLNVEKINGTEYYVLYEKVLDKDIENYTDSYRLRMWVKEDATDYYEKMFALKVDVVAVQVGE